MLKVHIGEHHSASTDKVFLLSGNLSFWYSRDLIFTISKDNEYSVVIQILWFRYETGDQTGNNEIANAVIFKKAKLVASMCSIYCQSTICDVP